MNKKRAIFALLCFMSESLITCIGMESEPNKFDQELHKIIKGIELKGRHETGIMFDGRKIYRPHHLNEWWDHPPKIDKSYTDFDARPIEEAVLMHTKELTTPNRRFHYDRTYYSSKHFLELNPPYQYGIASLLKNDRENPILTCNFSLSKTPLSLQTLATIALFRDKNNFKQIQSVFKKISIEKIHDLCVRYLLSNPKAPRFTQSERTQFIEQYVPPEHRLMQHCISQSLDEQLICYLKNKSKKTDTDLSEIQTVIESYLKEKEDITTPITYCILADEDLFSKNPCPTSLQLAEWLLHQKNGWYYLDTLLIDSFGKRKNTFLTCLALTIHYQRLKKSELPRLSSLLGNGTWFIHLINRKLYTQQDFNETLLEAIDRYDFAPRLDLIQFLIGIGANNFDEALKAVGHDLKKHRNSSINAHSVNIPYYYHFPIINFLLEKGANPNQLFYTTSKGRKRCCLKGYYTKKTMNILKHPLRIREQGEPTDFEYLRDTRLLVINSLFESREHSGQQDLYHYAIQVYQLAIEGHKTNNFEPLRDLIMDRYHKSKVIEPKSATKTKIDILTTISDSTKNQVSAKSTWLNKLNAFNMVTQIASVRFWFLHKLISAYRFVWPYGT